MKIIIATDSFKGTLKSYEACQIIAESIAECLPGADLVIKPMADGGEGTAQAVIKAANGQWIRRTVMGPLAGMQVEAGFAWFSHDRTALVEMASASGLELLSEEQMNPLEATTYGTGQLIKAALEYGAREILLAVGGSATVDGGAGAAAALGWRFLDCKGEQIALGGGNLSQIAEIVEPEDLPLPPVQILCDVDNPLCGRHGAARIYGPQKGANPQMVEQLEEGLVHLAGLIKKHLHRDISEIPGAGAAGGLAAGALAFMSGTVVSGIETVMDRSSISTELQSADWVITGEGSFDLQSLRGKVISGIARMASKSQTLLAVIAGQVSVPRHEYERLGIITAVPCRKNGMSLNYALENCRPLLREAARQLTMEWLVK
jgi:glycerate kinase